MHKVFCIAVLSGSNFTQKSKIEFKSLLIEVVMD